MSNNKNREAGASFGSVKLIDDINFDTLLDLEPIPVNNARIKKLTAKKISTQQRAQRWARPNFRLLVAAIIVFCSLFIGAAGYAVVVGENPIDFFFHYDGDQVVNVPEGGVPIYGHTLPNLDQFNIPIGQTIESDGVAVTLDSVSIDDNFVVAFLTYSFDEPVDPAAIVMKGYSDYVALQMFTAQPTILLDDLVLSKSSERGSASYLAKDTSAYFADDENRVIKKAVQYLIPEMMPDQLDLTVIIEPFTDRHVLVSAVPERLTFKVEIDKSPASAYTVAVEPGIYEFMIEDVVWKLDLKKFAVTPFGTIVVIDTHEAEGEKSITHYLGFGDYMIVDQNGTGYYSMAPASAQQNGLEAAFYLEFPVDVTSISIIPITKIAEPRYRYYQVTDIGAKMETTSTSGFYLQDYRVFGNTITIVAEPYGYPDFDNQTEVADGFVSSNGDLYYPAEFIFDEGDIDPWELAGMVMYTADPETGLYTMVYTAYTANEETLLRIRSFHVYYDPYANEGPTFDSTQTLTLILI